MSKSVSELRHDLAHATATWLASSVDPESLAVREELQVIVGLPDDSDFVLLARRFLGRFLDKGYWYFSHADELEAWKGAVLRDVLPSLDALHEAGASTAAALRRRSRTWTIDHHSISLLDAGVLVIDDTSFVVATRFEPIVTRGALWVVVLFEGLGLVDLEARTRVALRPVHPSVAPSDLIGACTLGEGSVRYPASRPGERSHILEWRDDAYVDLPFQPLPSIYPGR